MTALGRLRALSRPLAFVVGGLAAPAACSSPSASCVATRTCALSADASTEDGAASDSGPGGAAGSRFDEGGRGGAGHGGASGGAGEPGGGPDGGPLPDGGADRDGSADAGGSTDGGTRAPEPLYISPGGDDVANTGTEFSPYKTFDKAASVAVSGQKILAAAGTYGGADFSKPLPAGVTVDRSSPSGVVTFAPSVPRLLVFAGSGKLRNVTLEGFFAPLAASTGALSLESVVVTNPTGAMSITGDAHVTLTGVDVSGLIETASVPFVSVDTSATLTMSGGSIAGKAADCTAGKNALGIVARDAGAVSLSDVSFSGQLGLAVDHQASGALTISNGYFRTCDQALAALIPKSGLVTIRGSTFWGSAIVGGTGKVLVRGSTFWGTLGVILGSGDATSVFDLGLSTDPGQNDFSHTTQNGLLLFAGGLSADASGNTWVGALQGADAQGHYAVGTVVTAPGRNIGMASGDSVRL